MLFLLQLHRTHAANCLLPLNSFLLSGLEHLFVLNAELAALNVESVEGGDDRIGIRRLAEIREGKPTELS